MIDIVDRFLVRYGLHLLAAFVAISWLFVPLQADAYVWWGWALRAQNSDYHGLEAIIQVLEVKGILARALYYNLHAFAALFCDGFDLRAMFLERALSLVYLMTLLGAAVALLPRQFVPDCGRPKSLSALVIALFAQPFCTALTPEHFAIAIVALSLALYLAGAVPARLAGGALLGLTFFLKGPLPLMGGFVVCAAWLLRARHATFEAVLAELRCLVPYLAGMVAALGLPMLYLAACHPQELSDLAALAEQRSMMMTNSVVLYAVRWIFYTFLGYLPLAVGAGAAVYLLATWRRSWLDAAAFVAMFLFPAVYVGFNWLPCCQHVALLVLPAIVSLALCARSASSKAFVVRLRPAGWAAIAVTEIAIGACVPIQFTRYEFQTGIVAVAAIATPLLFLCGDGIKGFMRRGMPFVFAFLLVLAFGVYAFWEAGTAKMVRLSAGSIQSSYTANREAVRRALSDVEASEPVMFLDFGYALTYIDNPSWLRAPQPYMIGNALRYALPLNDRTVSDAYQRACSYKGPAIFCGGVGSNDNDDISEHPETFNGLLAKHYHKVLTLENPKCGNCDWGYHITLYRRNSDVP